MARFNARPGPSVIRTLCSQGGIAGQPTIAAVPEINRQGLAKCDRPIASDCFSGRVVLLLAIGKTDKSTAYQKVARYWRDYVRKAPRRRRLYCQRKRGN